MRKYVVAVFCILALLMTFVSCDKPNPPTPIGTTGPDAAETATDPAEGTPAESEQATDPIQSEESTEEPTDPPAPATYPITVMVEGSGTVVFNGESLTEALTKSLSTDDSIAVSATPEPGFRFQGWFELTDEGLTLLHEEAEAQFTVPSREAVILAVFEQAFTLSVYSDDPARGHFTADGEVLNELDWAAAGELTVELVAIPEKGYVFDAWYEVDADGTESRYSNEPTLELTYGLRNLTLICRFTEQTEFTAHICVAGEGRVIINGVQKEHGDSATFTVGENMTCVVYPADGYRFVGWYERKAGEEDTFLDELTEITFIMPARDCTLVAVFEKNCVVSLSPDAPAHGYLTVEGITGSFLTYNVTGKGTTATVTAHAAEGYAFAGWYDTASDSLVSAESALTVTVAESCHIEARFVTAHLLQVKATAGGSVSLNGSQPSDLHILRLPAGAEFTVTARADEGYAFKGLYTMDENGKPDRLIASASGPVIDTMPEGPYGLIAVFEPSFEGYITKIFVDDVAQGILTVEGFTGTYTQFEDVRPSAHSYTVTATATPEYRFKGWYRIDGDQATLLSRESTYTVAQSNAHVTVQAVFVRTYPVKFITEGLGTFIANGQVVDGVLNSRLSVEDTMTLKAIPEAYGRFKGWYERVEGQPDTLLYEGADVVFTVPARDCVVVAVFESSYLLSVSAEGYTDGCITAEGFDAPLNSFAEHYYYDETVSFTAIVPEGYRFGGWYEVRGGDRFHVSDRITLTVTVGDRDLCFIALFEKLCTVKVELMGDGQVLHEESGVTHGKAFSMELAQGDTFTLTIPWSGEWALDGWYTVTAEGKLGDRISGDSVECAFTVHGDMTLCAVFVPKYLLSVSVVDGLGSFRVNDREEAYSNWGASDVGPYTYALTAVSPVGYSFAGWYESVDGNDFLVSHEPVYYATVDGCDRRLYPLFEKAEDVLFTIYVGNFEGGTLSCNGETVDEYGCEWMMPAGSTVTVTAVAKPGYVFEGWYFETYSENYEESYLVFCSEEPTVTLSLPVDEAVTLVAFFEKDPLYVDDVPPIN